MKILESPPAVIRLLLAVLICLSASCGVCCAQTKKPDAKSTYKLKPMDLLKIQVFQEPDLDRELRVSQDNSITLPLIGNVEVKNLAVRELEALLTEKYRQSFLVNPQINVTVLEYTPRSVNVLGAVNSPGTVPIPPEGELTLLDAVARSGGFSRLASRTKIIVSRQAQDGRNDNFVVNADQLIASENAAGWSLQNGDVIYIPERVL